MRISLDRELAHRIGVSTLLFLWISIVLVAARNVGYMGETIPIIFYIGLLLMSSFVRKKALRYTLLTVAVLVLLKWEYYPQVLWSQPIAFFVSLKNDLVSAVQSLFSHDYQYVTNGVRTLAFLGVITFGTRLLEEGTSRPYWMMVATVAGEFSLIDLATTYQVQDAWAIVCFFLIGLTLLMWMHLPRLHIISQLHSYRALLRQASAPILLVVAMMIVGLLLPKQSATWPKPTALWHAILLSATGSQASNYGANDNALGGPFNGSPAVFFRVIANGPSYYQGQTLDTYTGTGWTPDAPFPTTLRAGHALPDVMTQDMGPTTQLATQTITQHIQDVRGTYPVAFAGYQVTKVMPPKGIKSYTVDTAADSISFGTLKPGQSYTVTSEVPIVSNSELSHVHDGNLAYAFPQDLELPKSLPYRVVQLAKKITAGKSGTLAKVEAIIGYLQSHETYETQNIPFIKPGQDFVDQFLFVTHRGYCDFFSSSLAVLARAVNIPTRWVKGFVSVPANPNYHGNGKEYVLHGTDAHSWTQVWFAGYGWVPFEATPSFVLPNAQTHSQTHHIVVAAHSKVNHPTAVSKGTKGSAAASHLSKFFAAILVVLGAILVLIALIWLFIVGWHTWYRARQKKLFISSKDRALDVIMHRFYRLVGQKPQGLTLREFVMSDLLRQVRHGLSQESARAVSLRFVLWYETMRYGEHVEVSELTQGNMILRDVARCYRRKSINLGAQSGPSVPNGQKIRG